MCRAGMLAGQVWKPLNYNDFWKNVCPNNHTRMWYNILCKVKAMWHTAKYGDPYSEFVIWIYPSKVHTHSSEHTPGAVGSHLCCGTRGAVGGSVPCSRAPQSWYWGWREHCTFTPLTYNSRRPETQTFDYESDSLATRPRLPCRSFMPCHVCHNDPVKLNHNNSKTIHWLNLNNITDKK